MVGDDVNAVYLAEGCTALLFGSTHPIPVDFPWLHLNIDTEADLVDLPQLQRKIGSRANRMCMFIEASL